MTSSRKQLYFMTFIMFLMGVIYSLPFTKMPIVTSALLSTLFPVQLLLWRLAHGRKVKDYIFCFSILIVILILKHYWQYSDFLFYLLAIISAAVLHYRTLLALIGSSLALEMAREYLYRADNPQEIAFRYMLFLIAGSLTYLLLREEKRQKEEYKRELDDLRYGMNQVEVAPVAEISETGQTARKVDAAMALDESLNNILKLIHSIFKPETTLLWQHIPEKQQLRISNQDGNTAELKTNLTVALGEGPIGWAAINKKTFFQQDREEGVNFTFYRKGGVIHSLLAVPILEGERLEGVISLDSPHMNFFAVDADAAVASFAAQMAQSIRLARVARDREERAFEFEAFYHASKQLSSIIDFDEIIRKLHLLCSEIVHSDFTAVAVAQEDDSKYAVYEWPSAEEAPLVHIDNDHDSRTWISWFLQSREEPVILSESQLKLQEMPVLRNGEQIEGLATYLAVPMRHQQNSIGALLLASKQKDAFSAHQAHVLSILCNQAAVSLENSAIIKKMEQLAITDGLTHLFNHRYFQEAFDREIERSGRHQQPLTLILMDIDHFKGFNDTYGHPAGDFILRNLAALLKSNARKIDILARYGGEEFAALLPGIDLKNARKTAERWRKSIQRTSFKWNKHTFAITVSMGISIFPDDSRVKAELIEKADRALYDAKENGRNQVRHCNDQAESKTRLFG
jgi:diguanylate cyclase (GGDEF)-like protein